ncbi:MAG TPA: TerC family protein [Burkholderiales bacterium]|nr:TerC family protein [Burkholderiales bacterium]
MALLSDPEAWLAFVTLVALEVVLGIDNIVFISILADKLPEARRERIRRLGLLLAMVMRLALLAILAWLVGLTAPLFNIFGHGFSGRDLVLIAGGLFLIYKSTTEIHELAQAGETHTAAAVRAAAAAILAQIVLVDIVFSLDSIITAVGMVDDLRIMTAAVIASVALMMAFAGPIGRFISARPTIKMLALAFLLMIGLVLVADGLGVHVPKGYVYFAMAFSVLVEMLNLRVRRGKGLH